MKTFKERLQPKIQVQGRISENIPVLLRIFVDQYNPEDISVELTLLSQDKTVFKSFDECLMGDENGQLKFVGDDGDAEVLINHIIGYNKQGPVAILDIEGYESGILTSPIKNAESIYVGVELTPSGILRKQGGSVELHTNGNIIHDVQCADDITWW